MQQKLFTLILTQLINLEFIKHHLTSQDVQNAICPLLVSLQSWRFCLHSLSHTPQTHTHTRTRECLLTGVAGKSLWTWEVSRGGKAWRRSRRAYLAPRSATRLSGDLEEPAEGSAMSPDAALGWAAGPPGPVVDLLLQRERKELKMFTTGTKTFLS